MGMYDARKRVATVPSLIPAIDPGPMDQGKNILGKNQSVPGAVNLCNLRLKLCIILRIGGPSRSLVT